MASTPTYKPSVYVGRVDPKKIEPLVDDAAAKKANYPGLNRATSGEYPPGSTWKPVTALAAMQEHLLEPYQSLSCTPTATYGADEQEFVNWDPYVNHSMTLPEALARSCDTYFYQVGYRFYLDGKRGRSRMQEWARRFGFGGAAGHRRRRRSRRARARRPAWRKETFTGWDAEWNPGDSIQLSIGQKDVSVTPLQMARFYAMIANGGKLVTPYLVCQVEPPAPGGQSPVVERRFTPDPPRSVGRRSGGAARHPRRPLLRDALDATAPPRASSPASRADRRQDRHGGEGRPDPRLPGRATSRISPGGAATGRPRPRSRASSSAR